MTEEILKLVLPMVGRFVFWLIAREAAKWADKRCVVCRDTAPDGDCCDACTLGLCHLFKVKA